jgi:hypothetical protein
MSEEGTSVEHFPRHPSTVGSADDVSTTFCGLLFLLLELFSHIFLLTDFDEKNRLFGH